VLNLSFRRALNLLGVENIFFVLNFLLRTWQEKREKGEKEREREWFTEVFKEQQKFIEPKYFDAYCPFF
jgi:hypothetical protein